MQIFVVVGSTSDYPDRPWPVAAFMNEDNAERRVKDVTKAAEEIEAKLDMLDMFSAEGQALLRSNPYDPNMRIDYTGTFYYYFSVDLDARL